MSKLELIGTIVEIYPTKHINDNFSVREFIVETDGNYPQKIKLQVINDKCENLDKYNSIGDKVKLNFNVRGSEKNGVIFNNLSVYYIEKLGVNGHDVGSQDQYIY